ncbi:MAG: LTA synthase family protein, partial [Chitinophagaceae bacterium]
MKKAKRIITFLSSRFSGIIRNFASLSLIFLIFLLLVKAYEFILLGLAQGFPAHLLPVVFKAVQYDLLFFLQASWWLFIVFMLLSFLSIRLARTIYSIAAVIMIIGEVALIKYFSTAMVPLGADLYGYSLAEIKQTVGAAGSLSIAVIIGLVVLLILLIVAFRLLSRKISLGIYAPSVFVLLALLTVLINPQRWISPANFGSVLTNDLVFNKTDFFFKESYQHFFPQNEYANNIYADSYIGDYGLSDAGSGAVSFHYVDAQQYPFLHEDSTKDVLSAFINKGNTPPDLVFLIIEGLGRAFTNAGAYLGNFTPFLDSLSGKSLYWPNFLSEGGRTFAVMPSVFGSLPFGKNGFAELGNNMPPDVSLISLLKLNGYYAAYYGGFDSHFDNEDIFMHKQFIDAIYDAKNLPSGFTKLPASPSGFTWGYGDKSLYQAFFELNNPINKYPQLDILQTVSTHSPFLIKEDAAYLQRFEDRMTQLGFTSQQRKQHEDDKMKYATIIYADDALRDFFSAYEKRPDFKNTIFFITGDHRMPDIPMSTKIDRYHVPLIIYSPLLKRTAKFNSISTHFDIAPSLLAFLKTNYHFKMPDLVTWMGTGLDTTRDFRNVHAYPFMQTKNDINDFIMGDYFLNDNDLFQIAPDLD